MRELARLKDRVELSLDGQQVFFLFFGSAVLACLVFVAGFFVGKRVEARALALSPPSSDPLAALDQLGEVEDEGLTYHRTLTQRPPKRAAEAPAIPAKEMQREKVTSLVAVQPLTATGSATALKRPEAAKRPDAAGGHYTLQLSAFSEKSEAEEFVHKMQAAGYRPYLVPSELPGKAIFYRVRMGDYATQKSAADAKSEFERKQRRVAYVAKL